jgi:TolB-like protein/Tfp pilus assembly protein PilF
MADSTGVLMRSMAASIRDQATENLTLDELVVRYYAYLQTLRRDEHAALRAAFEKALEAQPSHALGWACLAGLYEHEHSLEFNPLPDPQSRARRAAERSIEIDSLCQLGWKQMALRCLFERDPNSLRVAAEQTIQLNPLSGDATYMGLAFAFSGEWERAMAIIRRAIDLTPQHLNALHVVVAIDHYRRGEFEDALAQAKRSNLQNHGGTQIVAAAAAGQLQRVNEARAAFDGLRRTRPEYVDPERTRAFMATWLWEADVLDALVDGFVKARALDTTPATVVSSASHRTPISDSGRTVSPVAPKPSGEGGVTRGASIAVLPFTDMSAAKDQDWFCDGVAEEILNALSQVKDLRVAARASAFSFRGKGDDLKAIGDKLQVTTVLDGSVRRSGDQLRITVRLSDVRNGYQLWSERYDRSLTAIFDVQEEIAKAVAARLSPSDDSMARPQVVRHTENQEAYHLYLRGRHLWYSRTKGSLQRAQQLFEEASRKDPNYVLPWVGLADLFAIQSLYGFEREEYANRRALDAANQALALNDRVADAHRARGFSLLFCGNYDPKAAADAFERSLALDPTSGLSHAWFGWPTWPGRDDVAIAAARRAQELDPLNPYIHCLAGATYDAYGHSQDALRQFDKAVEIDPNYLVAQYYGGGVYSKLGLHDEALKLFAKGVELSGRAPYYLSCYAWGLARAGRVEEARAGLAELESRATTEYVQHLQLAVVHSALGDLDRAFELLELAVRDHSGWIGCPRIPLFENFRRDPRYAEHLRRIGHPDAEWASTTR